MEVVALSGSAPFKREEIREWQHIDAKTGALLSGRAEANRYVNGNINTYGKSLLQSFETSDGTKHKQHKQMNILQTITSTGGALQVVRAQTIQTSHSSSRRAITSSTYSQHYTNGAITSASINGGGSSGGGDLLSISPRILHHHEQQQQQQQHSPSRMKASSSSHFNAAHGTATTIEGNRKNHLFHHANNDMDQPTTTTIFKNGVGSSEQQMRQQQMNEMLYGVSDKESFSNSLLRGKSASIEELANIVDDDDLKPYDWKRVSKIRRSLQFPKTSETSRRIQFTRPSWPADLPENSVNVWKIRQDIENGHRMNTAMRTTSNSSQNNIDFVALDSILKEPLDSLSSNHSNSNQDSGKDDLKSDCITAESLQEIRRRLRKLNVLNTGFISPSKTSFTDEQCSVDENLNCSSSNGNHLKLSLEQNCKSLELRKNKERDINTDEWLNRRKSYGFEKMQPSESSSLGGIESSTDSGLGRSSDLPSNWSPTSEAQRTIITFGDNKTTTKPATTSISLFSNPPHHVKSSSEVIGDKPISMRRSMEKKEELKRHSIAIDEKVDEHYQHRSSANDRKISLVNLNGPYYDKLKLASSAAIANTNNSINNIDGRQKKVEFCKTEIHFAAESGRVNIVETETKPPPTNNFRRRRRNSGTSPSTLIDSEYPTQQQQQQHHLEDENEKLSNNQYDVAIKSNVTTTIGSIYSSANRDDDTDECQSDTDGLRGILKNKPVKPKPYHLGENLDNGSSLWGVRLKPVENQHTTWRHSAELESSIKKSTEDALETEFKNLVKAMDNNHHHASSNSGEKSSHYQSTVSSNGYSTKINLSSLPTIQQHQHPATTNKDSPSSPSLSLSSTHKQPTTFTSYTDSRQNSGNVTLTDNNQQQQQRHKGGHKISIDLKLPYPSSMDTIMDELKSTSLIIKTMKSTSYFDDAMRHLEQESPLIRTSSLRLNNESSLSKSSSTSMMFRNKMNAPVRYTSSLDGDHGILDGNRRDDDFDFLNGFLEENRKFQQSIAHKSDKEKHFSQSSVKDQPVAAPRLKKIMNPSQQLSQQLSQLKHLYDIANDSDENAKADEEVKSFLSKNEEEKSISELSGSWNRVRVKKIASAFQSSSSSVAATSDCSKWPKTPLTSLYENSTTTATSKPVVEPAPRTSLIQIGSNHEKVNSNSNIYSNVNTIQQDNSVKVNIQNFESLSPALSRNNSLRLKKDKDESANANARKLSTGTRQLKAHELTYFGVKSSPITINTTDTTNNSKMHLSTTPSSSNNSNSSCSIKTNNFITNTQSSKVIINHHQRPDLIMHHQQKLYEPSAPELSSSEKKLMIETLDSCIDETNNLEPLYENLYQNKQQQYDRKLDLARDEKILDELTRAADEIMNTCKEMYHADSEEKKRKSLMLTSTPICLETIKEGAEGRQHRHVSNINEEVEQPKIMKSKGVQVSRNFEDSLRRYHRLQQRTSSQSSIESLPQNSKVSSSSSLTTRIKRNSTSTVATASKATTTVSATKSGSISSSTKSSSSRKQQNGNGSDGSKRLHRVCSRERMQKSNASSSESDLPNSSVEVPRRPRRTKLVKHHREENGKEKEKEIDVKKSSSRAATESSSRKCSVNANRVSSTETKIRSSVNRLSSSSTTNPNTSLSSPTVGAGKTTTSSSRKSRR